MSDKPAPVHVAAYIRVSTDEQAEKFGQDAQLQAISAYAAAVYPGGVAEWYVDQDSGAKEDRPQLNELRAACRERRFGVVLIFSIDRFARDVRLAENLHHELRVNGAKVVSVKERIDDDTIEGTLLRQILQAFAQFERGKITMRLKGGRMAAVAKKGTTMGGPAPYGYRSVGRRVEGGQRVLGGGELEVVPEEAEVVRTIFDRLKTPNKKRRLTGPAVARLLNDSGVPAPGGGRWHPMTVQRIREREDFYRGKALLNHCAQGEAPPSHAAIL